jgi:hypothetical protein
MDQSTVHQALYLPVIFSSQASAAPRTSKSAMPARPAARNLRFGRAAEALAQTGRRIAAIGRWVGQPADTFSGPGVPAPEDIRARYQSGVFGVTETPPSPRDLDRRW